MSKTNTKFWIGVAIGTIGGLFAAKKYQSATQMPMAKSWQKILSDKRGEIDSGILMARIINKYNELKSGKPIFNNILFDSHIDRMLLPGLALYLTLRDDGLEKDEALTEIDRLYKTWFERILPFNIQTNQLLKFIPKNTTTLLRGIRFITDSLFPAPGWRYEILAENNKTLAFNMHDCFYMKVLNHYNAPELTPVFCQLDDYLMDAMPTAIKWGRTQTMGFGAECCDFRWEIDAMESSQHH